MSDKKVTVVARFKARKGLEEKLERSLMSLVEPTRKEPGCVNYDLHRSADDNGAFLFYENWASMEALNEHLEKPYIVALANMADELLAEPFEITFWEMIS